MASSISLAGMYDLHVHASPSMAPRKCSALEAVKMASEEGMDGLMFLDHVYNTQSVAHVLNELDLGARAFGSILLNEAVGGLRASVVEAAVGLGTGMIQMPTYSAWNHQKKYGDDAKIFPYRKKEKPIRILDERERLIPEVEEILECMEGSGSFLGTGHLSVEEVERLVRRAVDRKVKVLVTSVSTDMVDLPLDVQKSLAGETVFMEHDYMVLTDIVHKKTEVSSLVAQIQAVGPAACVLATDAGQPANPDPVSGLRAFIAVMLENGLSEKNIDIMLKRNPRILLGL